LDFLLCILLSLCQVTIVSSVRLGDCLLIARRSG
jgi:hypothetical protein